MKQAMNILASVLIVVGIAMAAGSAGDCDGKCVENANSIGEMMMWGFLGLFLMACGAVTIITNESRS